MAWYNTNDFFYYLWLSVFTLQHRKFSVSTEVFFCDVVWDEYDRKISVILTDNHPLHYFN